MQSPVSTKGGQKANWWIYRTEIQQKNTTEIITRDEWQKERHVFGIKTSDKKN